MSTKAAIYLDANAGSPLKLAAREALFDLLSDGDNQRLPRLLVSNSNPSSIHSHGRCAKRAFDRAKDQIAHSLGPSIDPDHLVFTSSGTEANQWAVRSVLEAELKSGKKPHWITTSVEHDSNRNLLDWVRAQGGMVSELPVDSEGLVRLEGLDEIFSNQASLLSAIWVNNETGVITQLSDLSALARRYSIPIHVDAAQAWGKIPVDLASLQAQYVSFSGHKIGGLAGTGVLWVSRDQAISPMILGKQEKGRRGGTENTLGVIALGAAAHGLDPVGWSSRVQPLRDHLEREISRRVPGTVVNGVGAGRVANTLNLNFEGVDRAGLVMALDLAGFSVSAGSACSSGVSEPSHVLRAMGKTEGQAKAAIRISLVDEMPGSEFEGFPENLVHALDRAVRRMRTTVGFD